MFLIGAFVESNLSNEPENANQTNEIGLDWLGYQFLFST